MAMVGLPINAVGMLLTSVMKRKAVEVVGDDNSRAISSQINSTKGLQMIEQEKEILTLAYTSWVHAVTNTDDNELIAHNAKRIKYLIDWIGMTTEIENDRMAKNDAQNM
tara:strand:+ start:701 stop:1027 length:327 start_codon:yes stop_codon:yes gene_type:complete